MILSGAERAPQSETAAPQSATRGLDLKPEPIQGPSYQFEKRDHDKLDRGTVRDLRRFSCTIEDANDRELVQHAADLLELLLKIPNNALVPGERKPGEIAGPLNDSRESARVQSTAIGQRDRASQEQVSNPVEGASLPSAVVDMLLFCPRCDRQHIDEPKGEWTNPPHATHTCQHCGLLWRPANANTNGVQSLPANELKHVERMAAADPRCYARSAKLPILTCSRCGDEWRGQACVGDCPLWKMVK